MEKLTVDEFLKLDKADLFGRVVCFPTDTVYGIGALFDDREAITKIYEIKKRPLNKPLANLCSNINQILDLDIDISTNIRDIIDRHWPGALTIIFKYNSSKISFRMPDSEVALKIIDKFSIMTTTSVNESGEKELNSYFDISKEFGDKIDYFISDEVRFSKVASTVIDVSDGAVKIIRQGLVKI